MYIVSKVLVGISDFNSEDKFCIVQNNSIKIYDNEIKLINEFSISNDFWAVKFYPYFIHVFTNTSINYLYSYKGELLKQENEVNYLYFLSDSRCLAYLRKTKETIIYGTKFHINGKIMTSIVSKDRIFFVPFSDQNKLIAINTLDGLSIWQFDISKIGEFITPWEIKPAEVEKLIGVYNQILWVHLGNGKVIGLNIETGNLEHELNDTPETNIHHGTLKPLADGGKRERLVHYHFDEAKGKIFGLSYNSYCEINLKCNNPQFEFWLLNDQMDSFGIKEIYRYSAKDEDGKLYFFDSNECKWGVFNTSTKSIEWVSEKMNNSSNPKAFMQLKEIQYGAGRVYILDTNQVLHVFEKE